MATGYDYKPLDKDKKEIRLICIRPAKVADGQPLKCSLRTFSLPVDTKVSVPLGQHGSSERSFRPKGLVEPAPEYFAISYAWGDATQRASIVMDDTMIDVPASSEIALRDLTRHASGLGKAYFWIDALCINQSDNDERSFQVALMRDVFRKAKEVLLWMGPDDDLIAESAINSVRAFVQELGPAYADWMAIDKYEPVHQSIIEKAALKCCDEHMIALLFSSSVFNRLWIVQELALASNAVCYWGCHCISWYELGLTAAYLPLEYASSNVFNADIIGTLSLRKDTSGYGPGDMVQFEVSDPKDRVYALLGLMPYLAESPDYSRSLKDIYTRAAVGTLEQGGLLSNLLASAEQLVPPYPHTELAAESVSSFSSWTPHYDWIYDVTKGSPSRLCYRNACGNLELQLDYTSRDLPATLRLAGLQLDVVEAISDSPRPGDGADHASEIICQMWQIAMEAFSLRPPKQYYPQRAFATILLAGTDVRTLGPLNQDEEQGFHDYVGYITALSKKCTILPEQILEGFGKIGDEKTSSSANPDAEQNEDVPMPYLFRYNRPLISTRFGYVGLTNTKCQKGDTVSILFGCKNPVVLRPTTAERNEWTFVALAYIYGIMDGEAVQELQAEGKLEERTETFNII